MRLKNYNGFDEFAKIFRKINIGDNVAIAANAVVNKNFDSNVTLGGIPAKAISNKGSEGLLTMGYKK